MYNAPKFKLAHLDGTPIAHSIQSYLSHLPALAAVDMVHSVVNDHGVEVRATAPETPRAKAFALTYVYANRFGYHWDGDLVVIYFKKAQEQCMRMLSEVFPSSVRTLHMHVENVRSGHYGLGCKLEDIRLTKAWDTLHAAFPALQELRVTGPYATFSSTPRHRRGNPKYSRLGRASSFQAASSICTASSTPTARSSRERMNQRRS